MTTPPQDQPAFNNRRASYRLVETGGGTRIVYRRPDDRPYPPEVLEAARVVKENPCEWLPAIFEVEPNRVIAEYLEGYVPLSKSGVTSTRFGLFGRKPRRFKRWRLRGDQRDMARHFESFLDQLDALGVYLAAHGLWHDDVIPQNVMWNRTNHRLKLIDIGAMCTVESVRDGRRDWYGDGRTRGVFDPDGRLDREYVREVFLQDLDPWPMVLLRKMGIGIRK